MIYELTDEQYADLCAVFDVPLKVREGFNAFAKAEDESCAGGRGE